MVLQRRDALFLALLGVVLAVLFYSNLRAKPKPLPADVVHRPLALTLAQGQERTQIEARCLDCHNPQTRPLPAQHPPKQQCLICHPVQG